MPFEFRAFNPETDFPGISRCMFESHETPPQKFFHAYFPIHGEEEGDHQAREDAIAEGTARLAAWFAEDPTSHWEIVVDTSTGRLAGCSLWNVHAEDPFAAAADEQHEMMEVSWFPNDGSRRYVEQFLEMYEAPRLRVGRRPQVYLFILFTHPDYRRRGVAQRLLNWGMDKADEMGVEMFLDSTPVGKPLYEANKFQVVAETVIVPHTEDPDDAWRKAEEKIGHPTWHLMWRPVRGQFEPGVTVRPWEKEDQVQGGRSVV
ncbi:acyl-CoA N-acyltransferase [Xylariomycetidae sp. FL2044]|nr:acyl-CoA N-acyltransferase [Xylariomycetidae sp. FL2044]